MFHQENASVRLWWEVGEKIKKRLSGRIIHGARDFRSLSTPRSCSELGQHWLGRSLVAQWWILSGPENLQGLRSHNPLGALFQYLIILNGNTFHPTSLNILFQITALVFHSPSTKSLWIPLTIYLLQVLQGSIRCSKAIQWNVTGTQGWITEGKKPKKLNLITESWFWTKDIWNRILESSELRANFNLLLENLLT